VFFMKSFSTKLLNPKQMVSLVSKMIPKFAKKEVNENYPGADR
jgi:threonine/homoserine/homoserine lactone efflux protein